MAIIGYLCAMLVGISLGILGSGGSILTVPIMVYLLQVNPLSATGYSLFVVGVTSAIGGAKYLLNRLVEIKTALIFAVPSIISVFLTRIFLMPAIPDPVISTPTITLSKELFIIVLFALLMMFVAYHMIRGNHYKEPAAADLHKINYPWLICNGFASGIITGILGVGGGFIIIPALVLFAKIPIRMSVGTSLLIIACNSMIGFAGEVLENPGTINYQFLLTFALFSVAGVFIGFRFMTKIQPLQLKKIFGWFVLLMGICIFMKEIFFR